MYYVRNVAWTAPGMITGKRREYVYNLPICIDIETFADALIIAEVAALEYSQAPLYSSTDPITRTETNENGFTCFHESGEAMEFRVFNGAWGEIGSNTGHGHVWERPDGMKARCGGPMRCMGCRRDQEAFLSTRSASIFM